jgi:RNA ligase (TIGR02306 family)
MRKLASIEKIKDIQPIENADKIELAFVKGWQVVVKKNEFNIGDFVVYFEIDSWIPTELAPFLTKPGNEPKEYFGIKGEKLKTVRMRNKISQGLILPINIAKQYNCYDIQEGKDLTEILRIQKWEEPEPIKIAGNILGKFPYFIPKTDAERIQNINLDNFRFKKLYITEKVDGTSATFYLKDDHFGVCSRKLELKEDDSNIYWKIAKKYDIENKMRELSAKVSSDEQSFNFAIQGEIIGEGIQKNRLHIKGQEFRLFNIYFINRDENSIPEDLFRISEIFNIPTVPILDKSFYIGKETTINELLEFADGKTAINNSGANREGLVFRDANNRANYNFKVVSNKYLLKNN